VLTVILPTRNEVATIGKMIDAIRALPLEADIVVLDYKSTDGTRELAITKGVELFDEAERGKGVAVRHYLERRSDAKLVMIDADCTYPVSQIPLVVATLDAGSDVVMAYRRWFADGAMSRLHRFGNAALSLFASFLFRYRVHDVCTGLWGFYNGATRPFKLVSNGFTLEADLFANAIRSDRSIAQIPIEYAARPDGSTAKLTTLDGIKIAWFLLMSRLGRRG